MRPFRKIRYFIKIYILKQHPLEKFLCLVISIILFTYVHLEKEETKEYSVPITIKNVPKNLIAVGPNVKNVYISFVGKKQTFVVMPSIIKASVYAHNATEGTQQYLVDIDNVSDIPKNITFTLNPRTVYITFEKINDDNS